MNEINPIINSLSESLSKFHTERADYREKGIYISKDKKTGLWSCQTLSKADKRSKRELNMDKVIRAMERDLEAFVSNGGDLKSNAKINEEMKFLEKKYNQGSGWFSKRLKKTGEAFRHIFSFLETTYQMEKIGKRKEGLTPHTPTPPKKKQTQAKETIPSLYPNPNPNTEYADYLQFQQTESSLSTQPIEELTPEQQNVMKACKDGDLEEVKKLIKEDWSLMRTASIADGNLLHVACANGRKEVAAYLMSQDVDLFYTHDIQDRLPLDLVKDPDFRDFLKKQEVEAYKPDQEIDKAITDALMEQNLEKFQSLLEAHPNNLAFQYNRIFSQADTLLHLAVRRGSFKIVQYLVERKPRLLNAPTVHGGLTPLAFSRDPEISAYLMEKGGSLTPSYEWRKNQENPDRPKLLDFCRNGNLEELKKLFDTNNATKRDLYLSTTDTQDKSLLHIACANGHRDIASYLLKQRKELLNARDARGRTPLHTACEAGEGKMVSLLLAKGADINALDNKAFSPLHMALENQQTEIYNYLLSRKAVKSPPNKQKNTLTHLMALMPIGTIARSTVESSDLSKKNAKGQTPLHLYLATHKVPDVNWDDARALTGAGDAWHIRDQDGKTPLYYLLKGASESNLSNDDVINIRGLIEDAHNKDPNSLSILALENQQSEIYNYLLSRKAVKSPSNKQKNTLTHLMALMPIGTIARSTVESSDLSKKNVKGQTPLHLYLATHKVPQVNWDDVRALKGSGDAWHIRDQDGKTPLHYLLEGASGDNLSNDDVINICRLIKDAHDIDPTSLNISTKNKETLLHIAVLSKLPVAIIELLLKSGVNPEARNGDHRMTALELARWEKSSSPVVQALSKFKRLDS